MVLFSFIYIDGIFTAALFFFIVITHPFLTNLDIFHWLIG